MCTSKFENKRFDDRLVNIYAVYYVSEPPKDVIFLIR
jgi:hypothetical protein